MIYLFLDVDEYLAAQRMTQLQRSLGEPEMADLNTQELAGEQANASEILYHANTMPFLSPRRLVVVRGYLAHLDKRMAASKSTESAAHAEAALFFQGLLTLPDTCDLVLVDGGLDKRRPLWKGFRLEKGQAGENLVPGLETLVEGGQAHLEDLRTPEARALPGWVQRQASARKIPIEGHAAQMLVDFVGPNLRQLDQELEKLAAYAGGRPITVRDVHLMVADASEALIWDLTDALGRRNGRDAMRALYELKRNETNPFYLLTMIARQYRIMVKVKEAMGRGGDRFAIAKTVGENPYPVQKAMQQCRQYESNELDAIMTRLLESDVAMKTGADAETELDVLVAELTQR